MRKRKLFDDEATCNDSGSDESSNDGSEGSLADFIVDGGDNQPDDSTGNDSSPPPIIKRKRGRPRKDDDTTITTAPKKNKKTELKSPKVKKVVDKEPGHISFPVNDFSLTITKTNDDVGLDAFEAIGAFIKKHCIKGGVSTEVGKRKFQFHLQGIMRIHWPSTAIYIQELQKVVKNILPLKGLGYKVFVKHCKAGQNFSAMIGYITKDEGNIYSLYCITRIINKLLIVYKYTTFLLYRIITL